MFAGCKVSVHHNAKIPHKSAKTKIWQKRLAEEGGALLLSQGPAGKPGGKHPEAAATHVLVGDEAVQVQQVPAQHTQGDHSSMQQQAVRVHYTWIERCLAERRRLPVSQFFPAALAQRSTAGNRINGAAAAAAVAAQPAPLLLQLGVRSSTLTARDVQLLLLHLLSGAPRPHWLSVQGRPSTIVVVELPGLDQQLLRQAHAQGRLPRLLAAVKQRVVLQPGSTNEVASQTTAALMSVPQQQWPAGRGSRGGGGSGSGSGRGGGRGRGRGRETVPSGAGSSGTGKGEKRKQPETSSSGAPEAGAAAAAAAGAGDASQGVAPTPGAAPFPPGFYTVTPRQMRLHGFPQGCAEVAAAMEEQEGLEGEGRPPGSSAAAATGNSGSGSSRRVPAVQLPPGWVSTAHSASRLPGEQQQQQYEECNVAQQPQQHEQQGQQQHESQQGQQQNEQQQQQQGQGGASLLESVVAVDCEMVITTHGFELARVSLVGFDLDDCTASRSGGSGSGGGGRGGSGVGSGDPGSSGEAGGSGNPGGSSSNAVAGGSNPGGSGPGGSGDLGSGGSSGGGRRGGRVLLDAVVVPDNPVLDHNTRFSGITAEMLAGASLRVADAQQLVLRHVGPHTLLVGHTIENDLRVLRLVHGRCLDSAVLFPHPRGLFARPALRTLADRLLGRSIQQGAHDSCIDAEVAMEVVQLKLRHGPTFGTLKEGSSHLLQLLASQGHSLALIAPRDTLLLHAPTAQAQPPHGTQAPQLSQAQPPQGTQVPQLSQAQPPHGTQVPQLSQAQPPQGTQVPQLSQAQAHAQPQAQAPQKPQSQAQAQAVTVVAAGSDAAAVAAAVRLFRGRQGAGLAAGLGGGAGGTLEPQQPSQQTALEPTLPLPSQHAAPQQALQPLQHAAQQAPQQPPQQPPELLWLQLTELWQHMEQRAVRVAGQDSPPNFAAEVAAAQQDPALPGLLQRADEQLAHLVAALPAGALLLVLSGQGDTALCRALQGDASRRKEAGHAAQNARHAAARGRDAIRQLGQRAQQGVCLVAY